MLKLNYPEFSPNDELSLDYAFLQEPYKSQTSVRMIMPDDIQKVVDIDFVCSKEMDEYPLYNKEEVLKYKKDGHSFIVCTASKDVNNVVGFILFMNKASSIEIKRFGVHPEWRGVNRFELMLKELIRMNKKIKVVFTKKSEAAKKILSKLGFKITSHNEDKYEAVKS